MISLPQPLAEAIKEKLALVPSAKLKEACAELTSHYAQGRGIETSFHRLAYIAARLPATYGVASHVLNSLDPEWRASCRTVLDLGAGVGSLAWVAAASFLHLESVELWEKDKGLIHLGQDLTQGQLTSLHLSWYHEDITQRPTFPKADVTVISYVLNELPPTDRVEVLKKAYRAASTLLVLIEPGTPQGFETILKAREVLFALGAHPVGPCPHRAPCPLLPAFREGKDWCHFSVRVARSAYHRHVKQGSLPYEDEKYTYLIVSPQPYPLPAARIIRPPLRKSGHVILDLCTEKGEVTRSILSKKDGVSYRNARHNLWGEPIRG